MAGGIDREAAQFLPQVAGQRVEQLQRFDHVVEKGQAQGVFRVLGWENVDHIAAHAEGAAMKIHLVPFVLHLGQALDDVALSDMLPLPQVQDHAVVIDRISDAIDGRNGADDDHVAPFQQRLGGGKPHLLDVLVDRGVLLDE